MAEQAGEPRPSDPRAPLDHRPQGTCLAGPASRAPPDPTLFTLSREVEGAEWETAQGASSGEASEVGTEGKNMPLA